MEVGFLLSDQLYLFIEGLAKHDVIAQSGIDNLQRPVQQWYHGYGCHLYPGLLRDVRHTTCDADVSR